MSRVFLVNKSREILALSLSWGGGGKEATQEWAAQLIDEANLSTLVKHVGEIKALLYIERRKNGAR